MQPRDYRPSDRKPADEHRAEADSERDEEQTPARVDGIGDDLNEEADREEAEAHDRSSRLDLRLLLRVARRRIHDAAACDVTRTSREHTRREHRRPAELERQAAYERHVHAPILADEGCA